MGHYDLDYEMEDELRQIKAAEREAPEFDIRHKFTDLHLGVVYTIEDKTAIMLICVGRDNTIRILPGRFETLDEEIESQKWVRKALKAFKVSVFNR